MGRRVTFIHSLNTRPMFIDCYGVDTLRRLFGNVWYYSLSVAYAKASGARIVLHTDSLGAALLGHLPYDDIRHTLDDMPRDIHPRFWAAGKMWALAAEEPGAIHIDGDVFVKRPDIANDIADSEWDMIVQHYESSEWYEAENVLYDRYPDVCLARGLDHHRTGAYNTGVLGFRDRALRDTYISTYRDIAGFFSSRCSDLLDSHHMLTPDVIIEQRYAYQLAQATGARTKIVLPGTTGHSEYAAKIGFQHVITSSKFYRLDRCKKVLQKINPIIYDKTNKLCPSI